MEIQFRSAVTLAAQIKQKEIGCRELLEFYIARIEEYDGKINSIVVRDFERARVRANEADAALRNGTVWGPLHGVPMTVKESFAVEGLATTRGDPKLKTNIARKNMVVVDRLLAAGGVLIGKTNVPLMLSDYQSFNDIYGTTNNPWDLSRTPGGSSGGSAAALAAGLTGFEAGSDIAGSIRNPAHYCGVYGHKPTHNVCPTTGHELGGKIAVRDISVVGPMGRSAQDLELGLSLMAGPDEIESRGWALKLPAPRRERLSDFRIAVVLDDSVAPVDCAIRDEIAKLSTFLAEQGATVAEARPQIDSRELFETFVALLRGASAGRLSDAQFAEAMAYVQALPPGADDYRAMCMRADVSSHRDWHTMNERRHKMRAKWHEFFREWDVLLCPPAVSTAIPHNQSKDRWSQKIAVDGKLMPSSNLMFWAGYPAVCLLPATVAPIGFASDGLPVGVQIVAPQFDDLTGIRFAQLLEKQYHGFVAPPGYQ